MSFNTEEINQLIQTRRSIFPALYTDEKVSDEIVSQMLENANWAPNHKLTEPWRFKVFTGEGLKKLGELQAGVYKEVTEKDGTFTQKKYENLLNKPLTASHVIMIIMNRDEKNTVPEAEEISAVACAVQNMYLTATAYETGCYWGTGGVTYFEESKKAFGIDAKDRIMGFMYVGVPKKWPDSPKKGSIKDKIEWVKE